jgi:SAM-dependent methyltransferase
MTTTYDPNAYWIERGKSYFTEERLKAWFYREQEAFIADAIATMEPRMIVEVGCGFGRVTEAIRERLPESKIQASDVSEEQIAKAAERMKRWFWTDFFLHDLYSSDPLPAADVAVAIEVFLHHPADAVAKFMRKLLAAAPVLVHDFDPAVNPGDPTAPHCFAHDYPAIYREIGATATIRRRGPHALAIVKYEHAI